LAGFTVWQMASGFISEPDLGQLSTRYPADACVSVISGVSIPLSRITAIADSFSNIKVETTASGFHQVATG